jgi:hypothetical protein
MEGVYVQYMNSALILSTLLLRRESSFCFRSEIKQQGFKEVGGAVKKGGEERR